MTADECDHLVNISRPLVRPGPQPLGFVNALGMYNSETGKQRGLRLTHHFAYDVSQMRRSTVVGAGGKSVLDTIRTSRGTFLRCAATVRETSSAQIVSRTLTVWLEAVTAREAGWTRRQMQHSGPSGRGPPISSSRLRCSVVSACAT